MPIFGNTGLIVSPIGLGLAALGRPGYINLGHAEDLGANKDVEAMRANAHHMLDVAWESGIRYFDAARSYGLAEDFLGTWLAKRQIAPDDVMIGSKWGYTYTADWQVEADQHEVKSHTLPVLQRQWQETQSFIGSHLDLYQIHSATFKSGVLSNTAVLSALAEYKANGTKIGLSLSGTQQAEVLQAAIDVQVDGVRLFDTVQITWNPLESSATVVLQNAAAAGMGIIVKEALANGRLTPRNSNPDFATKFEILKQHSDTLNTTMDALVLAYILAQPWVSVVLSGAAQEEHLRSNLRALELSLDTDTMNALQDLQEEPAEYWEARSNLGWN